MQDYKELFNENGLPKRCYPNHWKGGNRIYCAGFSKNGLQGIAYDAQEIANDINFTINANKLPAAVEANAQIKFWINKFFSKIKF
jgi:indole-3-pyruvate monooxygenase